MLSEERLIKYIRNHGYVDITKAMLNEVLHIGTEAALTQWATANNFSWENRGSGQVRIWRI